MLSILNSQVAQDTDQAKAQKGPTIKGVISLIPTIIDAVTHDQEQAKKQSLIHRALLPSPPFVWPSPLFPISKGTANTQEEEQAQAQIGIGALIGIAIAGALVGAGAGRALDEIPLQEQAKEQKDLPDSIFRLPIENWPILIDGRSLTPLQQQARAQGPKKIAGIIAGGAAGGAVGGGINRIPLQQQARAQGPKKIAGIIAGGAAGGAVSGGVNRAINGQVRAEDIDLAELISLIGNHQAVQQDAAKTQKFGDRIRNFFRNDVGPFFRDTVGPAVKDILVDDVLPAAGDRLGDIIRGGGEEAMIEGGLSQKQLKELMQLVQEMAPLIKG